MKKPLLHFLRLISGSDASSVLKSCRPKAASIHEKRHVVTSTAVTIAILLCVVAFPGRIFAQDAFLDALDQKLTLNAFQGKVGVRVSGLLDLEGYALQQPAPGLLYTEHDFLLNPRLTLFLDSQLGPKVYLFAVARLDRGFDPADSNAQVRLDAYALRLTPWEDGRLNLQVGSFATVIGNWATRYESWQNPFVTAPLPYENLTPIWNNYAPDNAAEFHSWRKYSADKDLEHPIVWGPAYGSGVSLFGSLGPFDYAAEIKNAPISSQPEYWNPTKLNWEHPVESARIGWRPNEAWNLGLSESVGPYFIPEAEESLPRGKGIGSYREILLGQDASFAWHHWQLWAELFETRFQVPRVGNADTFAYYLEAKYKFTSELFGAIRWNQQVYSNLPDGTGGRSAWGNDSKRIDLAVIYRFSAHTQAKLQYSLLQQSGPQQDYSSLLAGQLTVRF